MEQISQINAGQRMILEPDGRRQRWDRRAAAVAGLVAMGALGLACEERPAVPSAGTGGGSAVGGAGTAGRGGADEPASGIGGIAGSSAGGVGGAAAGGAAGGVAGGAATVTDVASLARACAPNAVTVAHAPMHRLLNVEYDNTVRDLLALPASSYSKAFPPDGPNPFSSVADWRSVSPVAAEAYLAAAEQIAIAAVGKLDQLAPKCSPAEAGQEVCATSFIKAFGAKAFRRPLTPDEVASYLEVFRDGAAGDDFREGISWVVGAMLISPHFLYLVELGMPAAAGQPAPLTSYELASRLSYFFWRTLPSERLFEAAAANRLSTADEITVQATQMWPHADTHAMVTAFHREWLGLTRVLSVPKQPDRFPAWNERLTRDLLAESDLFIEEAFWSDGSLQALLTAPYAFVSTNVAALYGLAGAADIGSGVVRVTLDPAQRGGIFTRGAFLAGRASAAYSSPVHRGMLIRTNLLCAPSPTPPSNLIVTVPDVSDQANLRQRLEQHVSAPACFACHRLIDPIGFAFENFDAVGQWRTTDNGWPIDASGTIVDARDPMTNRSFVGHVELMNILASSADVRACIAAQWFRWALRRPEVLPDDACSLLSVNNEFQNASYDMRTLPLAIVRTDAFRYRKAAP